MTAPDRDRASIADRQHSREVCVWVSAGLLTYKLCDRNFQCDSCPLDAALTGSVVEETRPLVPTPPGWSLPDDRRYGPGHLWMLPVAKSLVRIGVDAFAARLLARIEGVSLPDVRATLRRGEVICSIRVAGGEVPLSSPISGSVSRVNDTLRHAPHQLIADPYASGWICEVKGRLSEGLHVDVSEAKRRLGYDLKHFRSRVASHLLAERNHLGSVMPDGGEPLTDLQEILGCDRFLSLVRETLS